MGIPDIGLVTMSESIERAVQVVSAINIPIIADADTGYGNAVNLVRTVREFERAGVAAIHIEDQITPKRCGHLDGKEVIALAEMEKKLEAALASAHRSRFLHHRPHRRARRQRLRRRGQTRRRLRQTRRRRDLSSKRRSPKKSWRKSRGALPNVPLLVNVFKGGKTPMLPMERLEKMGYRIAIYPSETQRAAIHAMRTALSTLKREGTTESIDANLTTFKDRDKVVGLDDWNKIEREFMAVDAGKN